MREAPHPDWLVPAWDAPGVGALMSTRAGGVSRGPFASLNLRDGLGDDPAAVATNRARFAASLGGLPVRLEQVHGTRVVRLTSADAAAGAPVHTADASITTEPGVACVVQVADCLPVLLAAPGAVGAAHAGWRGLAGGVIEQTAAALCEATGAAPQALRAWLGPCIGPRRFEVGPDVLEACGVDPSAVPEPHVRFVPQASGKWLADLAGLARDRLRLLGVTSIDGGCWCTVEDASRFFSFRRDHVTGRMAAAIWLEGR